MLKISVTNRAAFCCGDKDPITSGSVGYPVEFLFSNDWDGLQKIAVFRGSGLAFDVPLINTDSTVIPHEVLTQPGKPLRIGVYGANGDGDIVIPTVYVNAGIILPGTEPSEVDPSVPTPSWAIQVQEAAENTLSRASEAAEDAEAWAVGERGGEPVPETDPTYQNNAKYYAEHGEGSGAVQSVNGQTGVVELDAEDVGAMPNTTTLDSIQDGSTYKRATAQQLRQIGDNAADIDAIEEMIPNQASAQNQLADKDFVNSSINSSTAFFRGSFATRAALFAVAWQTGDPAAANYVSNNDYAYVADDESQNDEAWRYIYVLQPGGQNNGWQPQFRVNESPLTAAQLAALNSGATAALINSIPEKYVKPSGGIPASDLAPGTIPPKLIVDSALSATSENPVQNKVVKAALDGKQNNPVILKYAKFDPDTQEETEDLRCQNPDDLDSAISAAENGDPVYLYTYETLENYELNDPSGIYTDVAFAVQFLLFRSVSLSVDNSTMQADGFSASVVLILAVDTEDFGTKGSVLISSDAHSNMFTDSEQGKLNGIEAGAQKNVQSDWNATSGDAFIKNKPTIPSTAADVNALPENTLYAGSATTAGPANKAVSIPMGHLDSTSTATLMTAQIEGITELRDGVCMWLENGVVASASGVTLNINALGAKPIYNSLAGTAVTTTFAKAATYLFVYNSTRITGGCWDMVYGYDTNTTYTPVKLGFGYATCSTAEATAAKTAALSSYTLTTGGIVAVKFTNAVPANATLNINSKGAKAIYYEGSPITAGVIKAGDTVTMIYSTYYHVLSIDRDVDTLPPIPAYVNPLMDGTASIGSSVNYARGDHVHPSDRSKIGYEDSANMVPMTLSGGTVTCDAGFSLIYELFSTQRKTFFFIPQSQYDYLLFEINRVVASTQSIYLSSIVGGILYQIVLSPASSSSMSGPLTTIDLNLQNASGVSF